MFFVSDRHELKDKRIRDSLVREPMIAVLLAAANAEWTIGRCILVFGVRPNVEIRNCLNQTHGLKRYKALWKEELQNNDPTIPGLASIIRNWDAFSSAFDLRHKLIHGRGTCTRNMASDPVARMLQAVTDLYEFAASRGKDLNKRLPVRKRKRVV